MPQPDPAWKTAPWRAARLLLPAALAAAALAVAAPAAHAAGDDPFARGIDPLGAKLALGRDAFLTVEGARTPPAGSFRLGLAADYAAGLMSLRLGDDKLGDLVEHRLDLHLLGSWAILDALEIGADLPVTAWQAHGFDRLAREGFPDDPPGRAGLGDARILGRLRLVSEARAPVGVAIALEARLPTGRDDAFLGERGLVLAPRAAIERTFAGALRLAFEGGYRLRTEAGQYLNLYVGDELTFALAGSLPLAPRWTAYAELLAATPARAPFTRRSADALKTPLEALAGVRTELGRGFDALAGAGTGIAAESGFGRESWRLFAAIAYAQEGRPVVPGDPDGDGLAGSDDRCPLDPGPAELDGCPDRDDDGIPDVEDACPDEPGPAVRDGCPAEDPLVVYEGGAISLRGAINFDTDEAEVKEDSFEILDQVAATLLANPKVRRVRIEGHTDSVGSAAYNRTLSQRRAAAVLRYLVTKGVARDRLEAKGFGPDRPVTTNATPLGRAKNRRVEFIVVE
ncbi:MAG TPA: OmpA family protein [Vulgatibacter sp.]|nr:OmpA family protein [Vulgatibacter sp.]